MKTAREKFRATVESILHANIPGIGIAASALSAHIADAAQAATAYFGDHDEFVSEILENAPESWDGDEAAESIAVGYVRALEDCASTCDGALPQRGGVWGG